MEITTMQQTKNFLITIEETISEDFLVTARDSTEAFIIASQKYHNGEFILSPGNLIFKQMTIRQDMNPDSSECLEF
jgi:hypothetical protein